MPELPLQGTYHDLLMVQSVMFYPGSLEKRTQFVTDRHVRWGDRVSELTGVSVENDPRNFRRLTHHRPIADLEDDLQKKTEDGYIAGMLLLEMRKMGDGATAEEAIPRIKPALDEQRIKSSARSVNPAWSKMRSVAHLWAARARGIDLNRDLQEFLRVSDELLHWGATVTVHTRPPRPLLPPDEMWRVKPSS